jgi:hypothetical protein
MELVYFCLVGVDLGLKLSRTRSQLIGGLRAGGWHLKRSGYDEGGGYKYEAKRCE